MDDKTWSQMRARLWLRRWISRSCYAAGAAVGLLAFWDALTAQWSLMILHSTFALFALLVARWDPPLIKFRDEARRDG